MRRTALELYHVNLKDVKRSQSWFNEKIASFNKNRVLPNSILLTDGGPDLTSIIKPAGLYCYYYMPKGKDDLPHYDIFPLVFPISKNKDSFTGLNMHYLNYPMRFALFRALLQNTGNRNINETTRMNLNWSSLKGVSKLAPAQACIKQYLFTHVRSPFLEIKPTEWATAMLLPVHRFQKESAEAVWSQTKKIRSW